LYGEIVQVSHCAPVITLKPVRFQFTPESSVCDVLVAWCAEKLFQMRGPAAAKLLSPNMLWVRGTAHGLSVEELGPVFELW